MSRSLTASINGIKIAKQKLESRRLSQVAFAEELEISLKTINKFFTGKRVDRKYFVEICEALELEWEDVVFGTESEEEEERGGGGGGVILTLQEIVKQNSDRARKALDPYILPPIRRQSLLEKCLKQMRSGIWENKRRVIPILGAAGYGKSTILGTIYDELSGEIAAAQTGWMALIRCDDLIESAETFALEVGEKVSGKRQSIVEVAKQLTAERGRGTIAIDTLDIVLTKPLVPVLRNVLQQLLETGTTVAFTCRDTDYSNFFEPYHESFAGFRESVQDGCRITAFSDGEVREAAAEFVKRKGENLLVDGEAFADRIIALSTDSISLQEIVRNPLLLALLCDLFTELENVPEDLTVSQLYGEYWNWKVSTVRSNLQPQRARIAKEKLCLKIAEIIYSHSGERLRDFIYESNLEFSETEFEAYTSLKSEGVLKDFGGKRIGFFHQTFLEYTVARWLNSTESGEAAKNQLKSEMVFAESEFSRYYIWPIFRQLLTLMDLTEFYQTERALNKHKIMPFRAVTFASISRKEPESAAVLLPMLEIAICNGYTFQETLLVAANSAPQRHSKTVWEVAVRLLATVSQELINKAAETVAELLFRLNDERSQRFKEAVNTIKNCDYLRDNANASNNHQVWGKFLAVYCDRADKNSQTVDLEILSCLKDIYFTLGSKARSLVVKLYLAPGIPETVKQNFLTAIIFQPPSPSFFEGENATKLLQQLLPTLIVSRNSVFGKSWFEALHAPIHRDWMGVVAAAVSEVAKGEREFLKTILSHLLRENLPGESADFNRCNLMAISKAIEGGSGDLVALLLVKIAIENIPGSKIHLLSKLVSQLTETSPKNCQISPKLKLVLASWVVPKISQYPAELIRVIDELAVNSPEVLHLQGEVLKQLISQLPPTQIPPIIKKLKHVPPQIESYLQETATSKESRTALLKVYRQQAENNSHSSLDKIVELCLDDSRDVALDASWAVLNLAEQKKLIDCKKILPIFAKSPFVGVRQNCLKAYLEVIDCGVSADPSEITAIFAALEKETAPEVLLLMYKLIDSAIALQKKGDRALHAGIAEAAFNLTNRLVNIGNKKTLDMTVKSAFITLDRMALLEDIRLMDSIKDCGRSLLRTADISGKIDKSIVTGLLSKLARFDAEFLDKIAREDITDVDCQMPADNQVAVAVAIAHSQGRNSALLDEILNCRGISAEVKSRIIREKGG
ncbi:helix-turn-helix transcriptional regulator [Microcoleus sp. F4-D5]|uniref:helix-turn-helix transcriptional regulator n=1 Tax=Microcoleus sp. F4-D5 TaxID=2818760 RepID=UPI002FD34EB9